MLCAAGWQWSTSQTRGTDHRVLRHNVHGLVTAAAAAALLNVYCLNDVMLCRMSSFEEVSTTRRTRAVHCRWLLCLSAAALSSSPVHFVCFHKSIFSSSGSPHVAYVTSYHVFHSHLNTYPVLQHCFSVCLTKFVLYVIKAKFHYAS